MEASSRQPDYGRRLLTHVIDERARNGHHRPYASIPISKNAEDGFQDVSYATFANAINRCALWLNARVGHSTKFEKLAYMGPNDLRYPILCIAANKIGYVMFFPSPRNSLDAHLSLFEENAIESFITPGESPPVAAQILEKRPMQHLQLPELDDLLDDTPAPALAFNRTWEQARFEPWLVLHTSGSTGTPKSVTLRHGWYCAIDALKDWGDETGQRAGNSRYFCPFPSFHVAGILATLSTLIWVDSTVVLAPQAPLTAKLVHLCHVHGKVGYSAAIPSILTDIANNEEYLQGLLNLEGLGFGGGPLSEATAKTVSKYVKLASTMASTETNVIPQDPNRRSEDCSYFIFDVEAAGLEFREVEDNLYEMVIVRKPELDLTQAIFTTFPDLNEYHTKDLYSKHPTEADSWKYQGRLDDVIVFSNGEKFNPVTAEGIITSSPDVKGALVVGQGRFRSGLFIEPDATPETAAAEEELMTRIWPYIERANQQSVKHGRIARDMIRLTDASKPLPRAGKGTIQRASANKVYAQEIEALYNAPAISRKPIPRQVIEPAPVQVSSSRTAVSPLSTQETGSPQTVEPDSAPQPLPRRWQGTGTSRELPSVRPGPGGPRAGPIPIQEPLFGQSFGPTLAQEPTLRQWMSPAPEEQRTLGRLSGPAATHDYTVRRSASSRYPAFQQTELAEQGIGSTRMEEHASTGLNLNGPDDTRAALQAYLAAELEVERVAPSDDFFRLGMDSLQVIGLANAINASLQNGQIDPADIYEHPTIDQLASALQTLAPSDEPSARLLTNAGQQPLRSNPVAAPRQRSHQASLHVATGAASRSALRQDVPSKEVDPADLDAWISMQKVFQRMSRSLGHTTADQSGPLSEGKETKEQDSAAMDLQQTVQRAVYALQQLQSALSAAYFPGSSEEETSKALDEKIDETFLNSLRPADGGKTAWLQVSASFLININTWGLVNTFGVFAAYYEQTLDRSTSQIAWIGTVQATMLLVVGVLSGRLFDQGYAKLVFLGGSFGMVFSLMMLSISTQYWQIMITQGFLLGISAGMLYIPSVTLIPYYFSKRRGLALGIATGAGSFGGVIYPIVFRKMLSSVGFGWAVRLIGFIVLVILILAALATRPPPRIKQPARDFLDMSAFQELAFNMFLVCGFFLFCALLVPFFLATTYAIVELNDSENTAFYFTALISAAQFFGRLLPAIASDYIGGEILMFCGGILNVIVSFCWIAVHNTGGFVAFLIFYGFGSGMSVTLPAVVIPYVCPTLAVMGTRIGMIYGAAGFGVLISAPVAAAASASTGGFLGAQVWTGACLTVSTVCFIIPMLAARRQRLASEKPRGWRPDV